MPRLLPAPLGLALVLPLLASCGPKHMPDRELATGKRFATDVVVRDGTALHTRVLLPQGDGPFPTVFMRFPYPMAPVANQRCAVLNRHGYACVWQVTRGRGRSEGEWLPFEHEVDDGLDSLGWLVDQPFVDGNIALMGESYLGAVQWALAEDLPPEVKTFVPMMVGTDLYGGAFESGLMRHDIVSAWMTLMPGDRFRLLGGYRHHRRALEHRPRRDMDLVSTGEELAWYRAWQDAWRPDAPFWSRDIVQRGARAPAETRVPVLMLAGWSDVFIGPQLETWSQLATQAESTLVIGPWDHLGHVAADVSQPGVDAGHGKTYVQWPRILDWFDHHLRGRPARFEVGGVVSWPVNGEGWITREAWPPPTETRSWGLAAGEDPQACAGELVPPGQISTDAAAVSWTYDPEDPTPTTGGAGLLAGVLPGWRGVKPGFTDQGRLCERRDDLLGFRSAPLESAMHVAGPLTARLVVTSDAPDTALNVRFLEERPDGRRIHVREGIVSLSLRDGVDTEAHVSGEPTHVSVETWPVEYVFEAGSRLLVQVASASFPKYEAHANRAEPWTEVVETVPARQGLVLGGSWVDLPVLPR